MIADFYELLGRGIIAARTNRYAEAQKYLSLAAKVEPANPRVWLWLAASANTVEQKCFFLEESLNHDPDLTAAKVLLNRLRNRPTLKTQPSSDFVIFPCPNCGGKQRFDPDVKSLVCEYCHHIELLETENASDAGVPLGTALQKDRGNWAVGRSQAACGACGAQITISAERSNHLCPFCGSEKITTKSTAPALIPPTAIAPFQLHLEDTIQILSDRWETPAAKLSLFLDHNKAAISAIYLPFWTFDSRVQIRCILDHPFPAIEYSEHERVIRKGEWPAEKNWFECDIEDFSVYAARSISAATIEKIAPFDLKAALSYRPEMLLGWQAEQYQISLKDAAVVAHKQMRDIAFQRAARRHLFMEPAHMLIGDVIILDQTCKLVLLPVWVARMKKEGQTCQLFINGQTGKSFE